MPSPSFRAPKQKHTFSDFMYFKLLTAIPLFTVMAGFWKTAPLMIIPYLLWIGVHMAVVYRTLCLHCPHYGAYDGKTRCLYLWDIPPLYKARPGEQTTLERMAVKGFLLVSLLFPVYWLAQNWELLCIYLLSVSALLITMMRFECTRCIHIDCSHNQSPKQCP